VAHLSKFWSQVLDAGPKHIIMGKIFYIVVTMTLKMLKFCPLKTLEEKQISS
jgi:hypothetical protein